MGAIGRIFAALLGGISFKRRPCPPVAFRRPSPGKIVAQTDKAAWRPVQAPCAGYEREQE